VSVLQWKEQFQKWTTIGEKEGEIVQGAKDGWSEATGSAIR